MSASVAELSGRPTSIGEFTSRRQFDMVKELARSSGGSVYLARAKDKSGSGREYILKRRTVAELGKAKDMLREYELLKQLHHPNIIECYGYFWDHDSKSLYIVLEYAKCGDLHAELQARREQGQHFANQEVWDIFLQILSGVTYIHSKGIVHRDIKSLNLLLCDSGMVKVGDFGVSRQMSDHTIFLNSFYGTPLYLSPELVEGKPYTEMTDVWSLGVVLYELLALRPPFDGKSLKAVTSAVLSGRYPPLPSFRQEFVEVVNQMLKQDPGKRPVTADLLRRLRGNSSSARGAILRAPQQQPAPPRPQQGEKQQPASASAPLPQAVRDPVRDRIPPSPPMEHERPTPPAASSGSNGVPQTNEARPRTGAHNGQQPSPGSAAGIPSHGPEQSMPVPNGVQVVRVRKKTRPQAAAPGTGAVEEPMPPSSEMMPAAAPRAAPHQAWEAPAQQPESSPGNGRDKHPDRDRRRGGSQPPDRDRHRDAYQRDARDGRDSRDGAEAASGSNSACSGRSARDLRWEERRRAYSSRLLGGEPVAYSESSAVESNNTPASSSAAQVNHEVKPEGTPARDHSPRSRVRPQTRGMWVFEPNSNGHVSSPRARTDAQPRAARPEYAPMHVQLGQGQAAGVATALRARADRPRPPSAPARGSAPPAMWIQSPGFDRDREADVIPPWAEKTPAKAIVGRPAGSAGRYDIISNRWT